MKKKSNTWRKATAEDDEYVIQIKDLTDVSQQEGHQLKSQLGQVCKCFPRVLRLPQSKHMQSGVSLQVDWRL